MKRMYFTSRDRKYQKKILDWTPKKIIDIHTHTGIPSHYNALTTEKRKNSFAASLNEEIGYQSRKELLNSYKKLFPGIDVMYASFPFPFKEVNIHKANKYVMNSDFPFLLINSNIDQRVFDLENPKIFGAKVYYDFVEKPYKEIEIYDYVSPLLMKKLDEKKKILMLHVPGNSLADKKNMLQVKKISEDYPNAKIILAHMGRCQTKKQAKSSFCFFKNSKNVYLDTSTVSNPEVFMEGLKNFGAKRIIYGSDSPLANLKARIMKTETDFGVGFITKDTHPWTLTELRKWYLDNRPELTFLAYHDLIALKEATEIMDISKEELEDIFFNNSYRLLEGQN